MSLSLHTDSDTYLFLKAFCSPSLLRSRSSLQSCTFSVNYKPLLDSRISTSPIFSNHMAINFFDVEGLDSHICLAGPPLRQLQILIWWAHVILFIQWQELPTVPACCDLCRKWALHCLHYPSTLCPPSASPEIQPASIVAQDSEQNTLQVSVNSYRVIVSE